jgi:tRNA dimethylallyltransferase
MMSSKRGNLIVIGGPTGSGKSALAVEIAKHFGAPIISTDSRQVYRNMAIGTAQPTTEELAAVKHYFIADREVEDDFNCGRYEVEALALLDNLFAEYEYVVAVGGSGLYIQALCSGMDNLPEADEKIRAGLKQRLEQEGLDSLVEELQRLDPAYAEVVDRCNPARVMRALEVCISTGRPYSEQRSGTITERPFNIVKIATDMPRDILYERINKRVDIMVKDGLVEEVRNHLARRADILEAKGVREIILDPGIGFAKTQEQNFALIASLERVVSLGYPVLAGISRKSFMCRALGITPEEALEATTALHWACLDRGASILRVHDTLAARQTISLYEKIYRL